MLKAIIQKKKTNDSIDKPIEGKPPPGDKILGINTAICLHEIEDGNNTEEVEEA